MKGDNDPPSPDGDQPMEEWCHLGVADIIPSRPGRTGSLALPSTTSPTSTSPTTTTMKMLPAGQACSQLLLRRHSLHGGPVFLPALPLPKGAPLPPPGPPPPVPARTKQGPPSPIQRPPPRPTPHPPSSHHPSIPPPLPPPPRTKRTSTISANPSAQTRRPDTPVSPEPSSGFWGLHRRDDFFMDSNYTVKNSLRQDSSVSSDSYSQTSSPSYTSRTMETPLLPYQKTKASKKTSSAVATAAAAAAAAAGVGAAPHGQGLPLTRSIGTVGSEDSSNDSAIGSLSTGRSSRETAIGSQSSGCTVAFPRSQSTPTLPRDAVVRISGTGSNISVHHKIKGAHLRKASIGFRRRPRFHRFHLAQIIFNAVALVVIGGGITAYFKANPSVRYVNSDVANPRPELVPGICMPVIVTFCTKNRIPYNYTLVPSYMGHMSQTDAQFDVQFYDPLIDVHCYELAPLFLCAIYAPKCGVNGDLVTPCRSLCKVFNLQFDPYINCELFADSSDTNKCVGDAEVLEYNRISKQPPPCKTGFLCDEKRCIPSAWRCDGHMDCLDKSDELNCGCPKDTIHCGNKTCISLEHRCNGIADCPHGGDERECLRLSETMGDVGSGFLEVYYPQEKKWMSACVRAWEVSLSPVAICAYMGYAHVNGSKLSHVGSWNTINSTGVMPPFKPIHIPFVHDLSKPEMLHSLRQCPPGNNTLNVELSCTNFTCGRRRHPTMPQRPTARIIGGSPAKIGDWPFLAAILGGPEEIFYCAGVLISDQWLLTASHCVGNTSTISNEDLLGWTIQLGLTRRNSHSYFGQKYKVKKVVQHPNYNSVHDNDVALFQLQEKVTFHDHLLPVCLPEVGYRLKPGMNCTVIGWGKRENNISRYEPAVHEAVVPILEQQVCKKWLSAQQLTVTEGMVCAGYEVGGTDACQGDSGGPLLCQDENDPERWIVGGIVSWGIKCAQPRLPGVYANVSHYVGWIHEEMGLAKK